MARKAYYTGGRHHQAISDYQDKLHKLADSMPHDMEAHAHALKKYARSMSQGQEVNREHRKNQSGAGQKKTNVALGG